MNPSGITPAPKITATQLRLALATRAGVIVQDLADGSTYALPKGLTKLQALDGNLCVVLPHEEAAFYLTEADGNHAKAARLATTVLAWEIQQMDARIAAWAARGAA